MKLAHAALIFFMSTNIFADMQLREAYAQRNIPQMRILLKEGAYANTREGEGSPLLVDAVWQGQIDIAALLLSHGADPNLPDRYGNTPLHCAAIWGYLDAAQFLLNYGADPGRINAQGNTPLSNALGQKRIEFVKLLLQYGAEFKTLEAKVTQLLGERPEDFLNRQQMNTEIARALNILEIILMRAGFYEMAKDDLAHLEATLRKKAIARI